MKKLIKKQPGMLQIFILHWHHAFTVVIVKARKKLKYVSLDLKIKSTVFFLLVSCKGLSE